MSPTVAAVNDVLYADTIQGILRMSSFQNLEEQLLYRENTKLSDEMSQVIYVIINEIWIRISLGHKS